jgi:NAD(P)-dependent dehydrogenase (short-subunit alcohol dehydrogenase family)
MRLQGKTAVITGGNRGIGLAIAKLLASEGCSVLITGRDQKALKSAVATLGTKSYFAVCDVQDREQVRSLAASVKMRFGTLDYLVNNAGAAHALADVDQLSPKVWDEVIGTNLSGLFNVCRALLPFLAKGGVVVNNISVAALEPFEGFAAYNASKAGALAFSNTLRRELRKREIRVTALIPGAVETGIWQQFWPEAPKEKMVSPETIARAVLHVLTLPTGTSIDELQINPAGGAL